VHLSELSWQRVSHPREVVQLGETVTVKVISVDRDRKRIGLSKKQLEPEPWSDLEERFTVGAVLKGEITRITDFGAFARVDGDVEGLIHVSELSDEGFPPEEVVSPGDEVALRVIRIEADKKRLGLSLKRAGAEFDDFRDESEAAAVAAAVMEDGVGAEEVVEESVVEDSVVGHDVVEDEVLEDGAGDGLAREEVELE
jgi:small subunit ribosomal protein S1